GSLPWAPGWRTGRRSGPSSGSSRSSSVPWGSRCCSPWRRTRDVTPISRLLVANRGEIAIRVMRAARELGQRTVAVFSPEDRGARHRFLADESYLISAAGTPINTYLEV